MLRIFKPLVILLWSLLTSQTLATNDIRFLNLLDSETRPSINKVGLLISDFGPEFPIPIKAGMGERYLDRRLEVEYWTGILLRTAAEIIPVYESTYPGAKWVFIGRDADAMADVFESFYSSIGQKERVYRFAASSGTFKGASTKAVLDYLDHLGLDVKKAIKGKPIIFVDSISKGGGRQARTILSMIYSYLLEKTEPDQDLAIAKKINFMGLRVSTTGNFQSVPPENIEVAQRLLENTLKALRAIGDRDMRAKLIFSQIPVVALPEKNGYANEAGYTHFIGAWHASYEEFKSGDGIPRIGAPYGRELRESVLWTQWQIIMNVRDNRFLSRVKESAKNLGHDFDKLFPNSGCEGSF